MEEAITSSQESLVRRSVYGTIVSNFPAEQLISVRSIIKAEHCYRTATTSYLAIVNRAQAKAGEITFCSFFLSTDIYAPRLPSCAYR